jgi:hypothetical protein
MIRDINQNPKQKKEKPIIGKYRSIYTIVGNIEVGVYIGRTK